MGVMDTARWATTSAVRSLKASLTTFTDAVDRIAHDRKLAKCRWGDHKANVIYFDVSASGAAFAPVAVCSEHSYGWWVCKGCGASAKTTDHALILFSGEKGILCHRCKGGVAS